MKFKRTFAITLTTIPEIAKVSEEDPTVSKTFQPLNIFLIGCKGDNIDIFSHKEEFLT